MSCGAIDKVRRRTARMMAVANGVDLVNIILGDDNSPLSSCKKTTRGYISVERPCRTTGIDPGPVPIRPLPALSSHIHTALGDFGSRTVF